MHGPRPRSRDRVRSPRPGAVGDVVAGWTVDRVLGAGRRLDRSLRVRRRERAAAAADRRCVRGSAAGVVARRPLDRVRDRALLERSVRRCSFGRPQLALWMSATRAVRDLVSVQRRAAHLNPQWSPDDRELYFVSDPDGTMNIYRLDLEASTLYQRHQRRHRRQRHHADQPGVLDRRQRVGAGLHRLRTRPAAADACSIGSGARRRARRWSPAARPTQPRPADEGRRSLPRRFRHRPPGSVDDRRRAPTATAVARGRRAAVLELRRRPVRHLRARRRRAALRRHARRAAARRGRAGRQPDARCGLRRSAS